MKIKSKKTGECIMKKTKLIALTLSGALVVVLATVGVLTLFSPSDVNTGFPPPSVAQAAGNTGGGGSEISVSGAGSINVNPDVAYISLGVSTKGVEPKAALEENNRLIAAVIKVIREKGVAEKDIRTTDFNMYPDYNYDYGKDGGQIRGYTVSNNVSIVVRDISSVGDVLGAAANAGANISGGVQFGLLDNSAAYNEALVLAIRNAVGKAEAIAGALGKSIGSPSSVSETANYYTPYLAAAENMSRDAAAGGVPVQTGKLTVTANVQMVYEFSK
jgi:uncharacterized protein YggE